MTVSIYTPEQQKTLFWVVKIPALFSISCSLLCLYHLFVVDKRKSIRKVYGRLWLMISVTNILVALFCMLSGLAAPTDTGIYGAFGNEASCKGVGAAFIFIFIVCMGYNAALAIYFAISIQTKMTEREFARKVEPFLHTVPCVYALSGVIVGLTTDMIATNDVLLYCWAAPSPFGCRYEGGCVSGDSYRDVFVLAGGLVEMNIITALKVVATFSLTYAVSKQQKKMQTKYHAKTTGNTIAKETRIQAWLFFLACFIPYILMICLRVADLYFWQEENVKTPGFFAFSLIAQIMLPLQGAMNMICYFRPKVRERQRKISGESIFRSSLNIVRPSIAMSTKSERYKNPYAAPGGTYGGKPLITRTTFTAKEHSETEHPIVRDDPNPPEQSPVNDGDNKKNEDFDDIAYLDASQLEMACPTFTLGEDMVGDARKDMSNHFSSLDMKKSSDLRSKEQNDIRSTTSEVNKAAPPAEDNSTEGETVEQIGIPEGDGADSTGNQSGTQHRSCRSQQTGEVIETTVTSS